jgi:hypothetical protein
MPSMFGCPATSAASSAQYVRTSGELMHSAQAYGSPNALVTACSGCIVPRRWLWARIVHA